jgi:hypothetical protein
MDMAIVAALLAVILVIVMVMYFRQFSRLQDVTEDRSLLTIANHSLTAQRDNWIANYDKLSASAAQHSKTLVSILDFLMEEAKVDPQWVLEKGGLDKGVMEYVHMLKSGLKAEQQVSTDYKEIIDKLRARREKLVRRVELIAFGEGLIPERDKTQIDLIVELIDHRIQGLKKFKSYVHERLDAAGIDKHEEQNATTGCRIGARLTDILGDHQLANLRVQEPDTGTTRPDTLDGLATVLGKEHDGDPRAGVMPGRDPSLRGEAVLAASAGAHGDEASSR